MKEIFVSISGNNFTGDGSKLNPFATIQKAQQKSHETSDNKIILVEQGKYTISSPIEITKKDNNTIFKTNGIVELCGALTLNIQKWTEYDKNKNIKVAQIQSKLNIDGFYVNGIHQILARYPNYIEGEVPLGSVTNQDDIKLRTSSYKSVTGGYIRAIHEYGWGGNSYIITDKDVTSPLGLSIEWVGDNNRGNKYNPEMLVIENIFEELDSPNEWYYERETGKLYYYPPKDMNLSNCIFEASFNSDLIKVSNAYEVVFDGFSFTKTSRTMFTINNQGKEYVPLLRGDWAVVRAGAVLLQDSENVTIINCNFTDIYGNAIFISGKNKGHKIDNNEFINIGSSCIQLVGLPSAVYEPSYWKHELYKNDKEHIIHKTTIDFPDAKGPKTDEYPHNILISNNHMYKMGIYEKQSCGINISISKNINILNNTIHNSARSCINVNDGTFGGHVIAYNDIFDSQRETTDHGPFNSWGRDRFWSVPKFDCEGNNGEFAKPYSMLDVVETIKIHNNRFHHDSNAPHSWGIDLDDGSSNYEIYNNLCLGIGIKLREGFSRCVHNNIIINGEFQIHCSYKGADDKVFGNIVINKCPWAFAGLAGEDEKRLTEANYKINNNWYFSQNSEVSLPEFWNANGYDSECIINSNPIFKDTSTNDYTITNKVAMNAIGFSNFDINNFGKPNCKFKSPIYSINADNCNEDLNEIKWNGAVISNVSYAIMSATATNGIDGIYFKNVPIDSIAYKMGYRTNTVIKEINGLKVNNINQFIEQYK